jgi:pimeloyl-ACP methyl ester carboxylesterase
VFNSCWHYDYMRAHEPLVPALFVYSTVDRTIRQEAIEKWLSSNGGGAWAERAPGGKSGRDVHTLVLDGSGHVQHWWRARAQYLAAMAKYLQGIGWGKSS